LFDSSLIIHFVDRKTMKYKIIPTIYITHFPRLILCLGLVWLFGFGHGFAQKRVNIIKDNMQIGCDVLKNQITGNNEKATYASGNVQVYYQGTVIHSDRLIYNDTRKFGQFRQNVTMTDQGKTLKTENLDFYTGSGYGYFFNGGEVIDSASTLTSQTGYYYPNTKNYIFRKDVVVRNAKYTLYSDTVQYNLVTKKAIVIGPTEIISDSNYMYCESGWYDMEKDQAMFKKNAYMKHKYQRLSGDSVFYDKKLGIGKAYKNIQLYDSVENAYVKGEYALYHENPERAVVTGKALFIQISGKDSLFLHADTLLTHYDSTGRYQIVKAYYHSQLFRYDLQGRCDSILYSMQDSVINLFGAPILWSHDSQITADTIRVFTKNNSPDYFRLENSAYIISQDDTTDFFNQIKGKTMIGYFRESRLYKIDVLENGESIYFPKDKDIYIGMNKAECEKMRILLDPNSERSKVKRIQLLSASSGTLHPIFALKPEDMKLRNFKWLDYVRPSFKQDIFIWKEVFDFSTTNTQTKN